MNSFIKKIDKDYINKKLEKNNIQIDILEVNKEKMLLKIEKDGIIEKYYILQIVSLCQVDIIENTKIIGKGIFIKDLGKWIYNKYNPIKYLYCFYGGKLNGKTLNKKDIEKITIGRVENMDKIRKKGGFAHLRLFDNQPIVKEYLGPMYEKIDYGIVYLRYEAQAIYNTLSH